MSKGRVAGTYKHSQETKDKIGKSNRGRKLPKMSEEAKKKISDYRKGKPSGMLGKKASDETKKKMSNTHKKIGTGKWRKGVKMSDETKKKISEALSGDKSYAWKGGLMKDKEYVSWSKNKRNRLKLKTIREIGSHTYEEWQTLKSKYNYTCPCCGLQEPFIGQKSEYLTEDHIIPLSKGGSDLIENIQPLCISCNVKKNNKTIKY